MEIKDRIIAGARALFMKFGVKTITMDDIARSLGISKKTIYQYFVNKDELVKGTMEVYIMEQEMMMETIIANSKDPIDEILQMMDFFRTSFHQMNPALLYEIEKYFPAAWKVFLEHKQCCVHDSIVRNLKKGIESGLFRKELEVEIMATLRMEEIQLGFNPYIFSAVTTDVSEIQLHLLDHFLHGICTIKGHKLINKYKQINEED